MRYGAMDEDDPSGFFQERLLRPFLSWCARRDALALRRLIKKDRPVLLDIGCGTGWITAEYARCGFIVEGLDSSVVRSDRARRYPEVRIHDRALEEFTPGSGRLYDAVVLRHVLEHFQDPAEVLRRIGSFLRAGGVIFVVVPNFAGVGFSSFGKNWMWGVPEHWQFFTPGSLRACLGRAGCHVHSLGTVPAPLIFYYVAGNSWRLLLMPFILLAGTLLNKNDVMTCIALKK